MTFSMVSVRLGDSSSMIFRQKEVFYSGKLKWLKCRWL